MRLYGCFDLAFSRECKAVGLTGQSPSAAWRSVCLCFYQSHSFLNLGLLLLILFSSSAGLPALGPPDVWVISLHNKTNLVFAVSPAAVLIE